MNNWCSCWFFRHNFTARRLYKSFGVKGLIHTIRCAKSQHEATGGIPNTFLPLSALTGHYKINQIVLFTVATT
jgi:hypothetical protein